jgi:hypothetical protein
MFTFEALESAEVVTRWTGCHAGQDRAGLAVLTARALYGAKRRTGWQRVKAEQLRYPFEIRRVHDTLPDRGY